jgi:hypothetical protein
MSEKLAESIAGKSKMDGGRKRTRKNMKTTKVGGFDYGFPYGNFPYLFDEQGMTTRQRNELLMDKLHAFYNTYPPIHAELTVEQKVYLIDRMKTLLGILENDFPRKIKILNELEDLEVQEVKRSFYSTMDALLYVTDQVIQKTFVHPKPGIYRDIYIQILDSIFFIYLKRSEMREENETYTETENLIMETEKFLSDSILRNRQILNQIESLKTKKKKRILKSAKKKKTKRPKLNSPMSSLSSSSYHSFPSSPSSSSYHRFPSSQSSTSLSLPL